MLDIAALSTPELDRLWLLDRLWQFRVPLSVFASSVMNQVLNTHSPPSGRAAVAGIIAGAWRDGLVDFHTDGKLVTPLGTREVHRWLAQPSKRERGKPWTGPRLGLTAAGGALWERAFDVRWRAFVDMRNLRDDFAWSGVGLERAAIEQELGRVRRQVGPVDVVWDTHTPFRPTYWHASFPRAIRASIRSGPPIHLLENDPRPWRDDRYLGVDDLAPVDLAEAGWTRQSRLPLTDLPGAPVVASRYRDGVHQLRLQLADGSQGVLELRPQRARYTG